MHSQRFPIVFPATNLRTTEPDAFTIKRITGHSGATVPDKVVHATPEPSERAFQRLDEYNARATRKLPEGLKMLPADTVSATVESGKETETGEVL